MSYLHPSHRIQLTSRVALFQEDELTGSSHSEQESDLEVQRLNDVVRRSLGNFEVYSKRQKLDNAPLTVGLEVTDIPFRLISWSLPPQLIHLVPVHQFNICLQRPAEDTVHQAQLRQVRAQEATVDVDQILTSTRTFNRKAISTAEAVVIGANLSPLPSLLVIKPHSSANLSLQAVESQTGHSHVTCCPLVSVTDESQCDKPNRKRKRRYPVRDRPLPAFFRPMEEWGGKTAGYAMGWRGSRPSNQPKTRRYARDNMRKGTLGILAR